MTSALEICYKIWCWTSQRLSWSAKNAQNYNEIKQFLKNILHGYYKYVDELSESKFVICSFIFSKVKLKNIQLCFTLSLGFSLLLK